MIEAIQETFQSDNIANLFKVERIVIHIGLEISMVEHKVADIKFARLYPGEHELRNHCFCSGNEEHNALVICLLDIELVLLLMNFFDL